MHRYCSDYHCTPRTALDELGYTPSQLSQSFIARMWQLRLYASVFEANKRLNAERASAGKAKSGAARKAAMASVSDSFKSIKKHPGWALFERVSMTPEAKRQLAEWRRLGKP